MSGNDLLDKFLEELSDEENERNDDYAEEFDSFDENDGNEVPKLPTPKKTGSSDKDTSTYESKSMIAHDNSSSSSPDQHPTRLIPNSTEKIDREVYTKREAANSVSSESPSDRATRIEAFIARTLPNRGNRKPAQKGRQMERIPQSPPDASSATFSMGKKSSIGKVNDRDSSQVNSQEPHYLSSYTDNLKSEIFALHEMMERLQGDLHASDTQLKQARKINKKLQGRLSSMDDLSQRASDLEQECEELRYRERALLEAVEELTIQNQDLIGKLKLSMQRELELSATKASNVNHGIMQHFGNNGVHGAVQSRPRRQMVSEVSSTAIMAYGTPQQQQQMLKAGRHEASDNLLGVADRGPRRIRSDGSLVVANAEKSRRRSNDLKQAH